MSMINKNNKGRGETNYGHQTAIISGRGEGKYGYPTSIVSSIVLRKIAGAGVMMGVMMGVLAVGFLWGARGAEAADLVEISC